MHLKKSWFKVDSSRREDSLSRKGCRRTVVGRSEGNSVESCGRGSSRFISFGEGSR